MKTYLVRWYDYYRWNTELIEAESLPEAKHKAFQMMCNNAGDSIYDVEVYEQRYVLKCQGECNPKPNGAVQEFAKRDYFTGMKIRRGGKDNG